MLAGQRLSGAVAGGMPVSRTGAGLGCLPGRGCQVQWQVGCRCLGQVQGRVACRAEAVRCSGRWDAGVQDRYRAGLPARQRLSGPVAGGMPVSRTGAGPGCLLGRGCQVQWQVGCRCPGQVQGRVACRAEAVRCSGRWDAGVQDRCRAGLPAGQRLSGAVAGEMLVSRTGA